MKKIKKAKNSLPYVIDRIINAKSYEQLTYYNNKLICMFLSPIMFIFMIITFFVNFREAATPLYIMIIQSSIFLLLGITYEIIKRSRKKVILSTHLVAILTSLLFMSFAIEYYSFMGPAVWIFGLALLVVSIMHNSRIVMTFVGITFLITGLGLLYYDLQYREFAYPLYGYGLSFFLVLIFIISFAIHNLNTKRMEALRLKIKEVNIQLEKKKRAEEHVKQLAMFDDLTELPNKRQFYKLLNKAIAIENHNITDIFVIFLDLDLFKNVNDTFGHTYGDQLLKIAGRRFVKSVRDQDIVARVGGDEFLIMMCDTNISEVERIAKCILEQLGKPFNIHNHEVNISCSIGISKFDIEKDDADSVIMHADRAMYKAKEKGKNCYVIYSHDLNEQIEKEIIIINSLKNALTDDEFELYYQPQIDGNTNEIIGFEALIRWNHPTLGLVYPDDFISIAEQNGMMDDIGEWVLRTACTQNKKWQKNDIVTTTMAVNLSIVQLRNPMLPELIVSILKETELDPKYLELEITENMLIENVELVKQHLKRIRSIGTKVSLDDFGTGYSSMNYLHDLPVDRIKIPMNFIHGIDNSAKDESIITSILALADNLNLAVIAEGVESLNQLEFLQNQMCQAFQGFYFSKPVPTKNIIEICKKMCNS